VLSEQMTDETTADAKQSAGSATAGVVFPVAADGRRSTSALGRAVVADALRSTDQAGALGADRRVRRAG